MQGVTLRRIPKGQQGAGIAVVRLHYSANPTYTPEVIQHLRESSPSDAFFKREMDICYEALEGTPLYPPFSDRHIVPAYGEPWNPTEWTLFQGLDPHMRTPHAFAYVGFSAHGECAIVGELWPNDGTPYSTREYAEAMDLIESDSMRKPPAFWWANGHKLTIYDRYMDTHGSAANSDEGEDYFATYAKYRVNGEYLFFNAAKKGEQILAVAVDTIRDLMSSNILVAGVKQPGIVIFEGCYEGIREFRNVRFPEGDPTRPAHEKPLTYRKHILDCVHYVFTAQPGYILPKSLRPSPQAFVNQYRGIAH